MNEVFLLAFAYLLGSIPTSVWVSKKFFGIDIRDYGSGNAGATNTFRVLGKQAGIAVFVVDMFKGFIAVKLAYMSFYSFSHSGDAFTNLQIALGLVAVLGHIFPLFAGFKGGKGIATLFGMILGIQWIVALCLVAVFVTMLFLTKYVSLSSITASATFPLLLLFIFKGQEPAYLLFAISTALLVLFTHHKNINRLINGNESKVKVKLKRNRKNSR
ncbi:MAG TPA: glycerol-3-phosphate 1-O-acyltransferase PlsY [Edaphocola sp.]|nr:glycerol-3-phosphate 1-O-acyltransferase PlsY [Edaphocola sp.]